MDAVSFISTLGHEYDAPIAFNEDHVCSAAFDDDEVDIQLVDNALFFIAEVGTSVGHESIFPKLLAANLHNIDMGDAFFAFDPSHDMVMLIRKSLTQNEYSAYEGELVAFIQVLRQWKVILEQAPATDSVSRRSSGYRPLRDLIA